MKRFTEEEGAKELTRDGLISLMNQFNDLNPTIFRMLFIETRKTDNVPASIFPCYPSGLSDKKERMSCYILQCMNGKYFTSFVSLPLDDMGVKFRIWTLPPKMESENWLPEKRCADE